MVKSSYCMSSPRNRMFFVMDERSRAECILARVAVLSQINRGVICGMCIHAIVYICHWPAGWIARTCNRM